MRVLYFLAVVLLKGRGLAQSGDFPTGLCYTDVNCMGSIIPTVTAKDCCVGTNDGRSYSYDSNCTVQVCIG